MRRTGRHHPLEVLQRGRAEHRGRDLGLDVRHQLFKHAEGLALILHQRITLSVRPQVYAVPQLVHRAQVILPLLVDATEEHRALHDRQHLSILHRTLEFVGFRDTRIHHLRCLLRLAFERRDLLHAQRHREGLRHPGDQLLRLRIFGRGQIALALRQDQVVEHVQNLGMRALRHQHLAAQVIHDRTLLVHDIVVLQRALADRKVLLLHTALRRFD